MPDAAKVMLEDPAKTSGCDTDVRHLPCDRTGKDAAGQKEAAEKQDAAGHKVCLSLGTDGGCKDAEAKHENKKHISISRGQRHRDAIAKAVEAAAAAAAAAAAEATGAAAEIRRQGAEIE